MAIVGLETLRRVSNVETFLSTLQFYLSLITVCMVLMLGIDAQSHMCSGIKAEAGVTSMRTLFRRTAGVNIFTQDPKDYFALTKKLFPSAR